MFYSVVFRIVLVGKFSANIRQFFCFSLSSGRFGTQLGRKDFRVLELHFTGGQIAVF